MVQGRCGKRRMAGEFGPEGGINSPIRLGEVERGCVCSAKVIAMAGSAAHRDVHEIDEYLRYHFSEGSGQWSSAGVVRGRGLCTRDQ